MSLDGDWTSSSSGRSAEEWPKNSIACGSQISQTCTEYTQTSDDLLFQGMESSLDTLLIFVSLLPRVGFVDLTLSISVQ